MDKPGVTRIIQWIRLGNVNSIDKESSSEENTLELLDSPGIIPASQLSYEQAVMLAICNDIGQASYDRVTIATELINHLISMSKQQSKYIRLNDVSKRYNINFSDANNDGDIIMSHIADTLCQGSYTSAADKVLGDFRHGRYGWIGLEAPAVEAKGKAKGVGGEGERKAARNSGGNKKEKSRHMNGIETRSENDEENGDMDGAMVEEDEDEYGDVFEASTENEESVESTEDVKKTLQLILQENRKLIYNSETDDKSAFASSRSRDAKGEGEERAAARSNNSSSSSNDRVVEIEGRGLFDGW